MSVDPYLLRKRLVAFLYVLMRDTVPVGEVERIVQDTEKVHELPVDTNKFLESYAQSIVERLESFDAETERESDLLAARADGPGAVGEVRRAGRAAGPALPDSSIDLRHEKELEAEVERERGSVATQICVGSYDGYRHSRPTFVSAHTNPPLCANCWQRNSRFVRLEDGTVVRDKR